MITDPAATSAPSPTATGATNVVFEPMKAFAAMLVLFLATPSAWNTSNYQVQPIMQSLFSQIGALRRDLYNNMTADSQPSSSGTPAALQLMTCIGLQLLVWETLGCNFVLGNVLKLHVMVPAPMLTFLASSASPK